MDKSLKISKRKASLDAKRARSGYLFTLPFILGIILIYVPILIDSIWFTFNDMGTQIVDGNPVLTLTFVDFINFVFINTS